MVHKPVEKNLKHKTDVLSWGDVPWEDSDLSFRTPSASRLELSITKVWGQLAIVAGVTAAAHALSERWLSETVLGSATWTEACVVAAVMACLTANGNYRPLPTRLSPRDNTLTAQFVGFGIVLSYAAFRCMVRQRSFDVGVAMLFWLALPGCLFLADCWTTHMLHWLTSDPRVDRDEMVLWRNAWCGRFASEEVEQLEQLGASKADLSRLRGYWQSFAVICGIYAVSAISAIVLAATYRSAWSGIALVCLSTVLLAVRTIFVEGRSSHISAHSGRLLGHWFLYQKNEVQPAWVMPSPVGGQLRRTIQSYAAVCLVAATFFHLLTGFPGPLRIALVAVLAPMHCLAIGFSVSIPTLVSVEAGLGLISRDGEEDAR